MFIEWIKSMKLHDWFLYVLYVLVTGVAITNGHWWIVFSFVFFLLMMAAYDFKCYEYGRHVAAMREYNDHLKEELRRCRAAGHAMLQQLQVQNHDQSRHQ